MDDGRADGWIFKICLLRCGILQSHYAGQSLMTEAVLSP
jgi:hypothetical protein